MPTLSRKRIKEINEVLDRSFFTSAGYRVVTDTSEDKLLEIKLIDSADCFIVLENKLTYASREAAMQGDGDMERFLSVTSSPGDIFLQDNKTVGSFDEFIEELQDWVERAKEEVLAGNPTDEVFRKFQEELECELNRTCEDQVEKFAESEVEAIRAKLAELNERLTALEAEKKITRTQHSQVESVIVDLNQAATILPKRAWYRTAATKFYQLGHKTAGYVGQQIISNGVEALMEGKFHIPHF